MGTVINRTETTGFVLAAEPGGTRSLNCQGKCLAENTPGTAQRHIAVTQKSEAIPTWRRQEENQEKAGTTEKLLATIDAHD